jgi:hypothetical protein
MGIDQFYQHKMDFHHKTQDQQLHLTYNSNIEDLSLKMDLYHKTQDQQLHLTYNDNIEDPSLLQFKSTDQELSSYACSPTMTGPELMENEKKQVCIG